jgi:hypothetical protein
MRMVNRHATYHSAGSYSERIHRCYRLVQRYTLICRESFRYKKRLDTSRDTFSGIRTDLLCCPMNVYALLP